MQINACCEIVRLYDLGMNPHELIYNNAKLVIQTQWLTYYYSR